MSYILEALKKIEHEKSKKRADGRVSIANDLLQEWKQPAAGSGVWKIVALVVAASLLAAGGTWFVLHGKNDKSAAVVRQSVSPQVVPVVPPVVAPPVQTPVPVAVPVAVPPPAVAAPQKNNTADGDDDSPLNGRSKLSTGMVKSQPVVQKQPVQTVAAPADIKLSGIAWQEEHSARRAVINGFLLKEGAVVSGAQIIDIQADRVRFSTAGGQFEIRLDAVLPADTKAQSK